VIVRYQDTSHSRQAGDARNVHTGDVIRSTTFLVHYLYFVFLLPLVLLSMSTMPKETEKEKETSPNDRAAALLDLSISLIDQALDILNRHLKEDRQMTHASKLMPGGSVGKHFRHVSPSFLLQCCK